ncbi:MAG: FAD-dependent oxidoreductase [Deltaproteobacteria bacterium]|nr:FAD-dependent oxidoreductase [Deltaproteobacteria bacterium]
MTEEKQQQRYWRSVEEALAHIDQADRGRPRQHFLILGAGIAGLAAAFELAGRGHRVEILEATADRVGGRLWTWRSEDGRFYGERSAMRIPHNHDYTHHYLAKAGLGSGDLRPFCNSLGTGYFAIGDTLARETEYSQKIYPLFHDRLTPEERREAAQNPGNLLGYYQRDVMNELTEERRAALLAGDFRDPFLEQLDRQSWYQHLQSAGASEGALDLMGRVLGIAAVWDWSMAALLRDELNHLNPKFEEIIGGFDRLPTGLRDRLPPGVHIRFNQEVEDIFPDRKVVQVRDRGSSAVRFQHFQNLLVTLPFPVLAKMPLEGVSRPKTAAIRGMGYASACKDLLAYETRFWEDEGIFGGRSKTDGPDQKVEYFREAYYPMDNIPAAEPEPSGLTFQTRSGDELSGMFGLYVGTTEEAAPNSASLDNASESRAKASTSGPATLLGAYTLNDGAKALQNLSPEQRRAAVIGSLEAVHGAAVRNPVHHLAWSWDDYRWTQGGVGITEPNYLVDHWAEAKRPEGRVFFAGEHLSIAPAWIQGALESSLREVAEMLRTSGTEGEGGGDS